MPYGDQCMMDAMMQENCDNEDFAALVQEQITTARIVMLDEASSTSYVLPTAPEKDDHHGMYVMLGRAALPPLTTSDHHARDACVSL